MGYATAGEIVESIRKGLPRAEETMIKRYGRMLMKILGRRRIMDAEDICQQVRIYRSDTANIPNSFTLLVSSYNPNL